MRGKSNPDFLQCIEKLSCSPLLYMNMQRFLKEKPLFKAKRDDTAYQAVYRHLCEQYFFHQDQKVRAHVKRVCGINIFPKKNIFSTQLHPYTKENHSLFLDCSGTDQSSRIIGFDDFQKAMNIDIHPFQFGNIKDNGKSKFNLKHFFLGILANSYVYGLTLYFKDHPDNRNTLIDSLEITDIPKKIRNNTFFAKYTGEIKDHNCNSEWNVTQKILNTLIKSKDSNDYIFYFFMLYLWNQNSLIVDAFLPKAHINNQHLFYPNFVGILLTKKSGAIRTNHKEILNDIGEELLANWSNAISEDIKEHNDSSNQYLMSSIRTIGEYEKSEIKNILFDHIINPFKREWDSFIKKHEKELEIQNNQQQKKEKNEKKKNSAKQLEYRMAITHVMAETMRRKDRLKYYYSPKSFSFDDFRIIDKNPFLIFHGYSKHKVHNLRKATLDDIIGKEEYKLVCPMQFLQLPKKTLADIYSYVDVLVKEFHSYLRNNKHKMNDYTQAETIQAKLLEHLTSDSEYKLDIKGISPLNRKDFYVWYKVAADFIKENIIGGYDEKFKRIKDSNNISSCIYKAIQSLKKNNQTVDKAGLLNALKTMDLSKSKEISIILNCRKIISSIDSDDPFYLHLNSKQQMISYCKFRTGGKEIISFKLTLFLWWICGYTYYLQNGLLLREKNSNAYCENHYVIKRISLDRLHDFQKNTCDFAILFSKNIETPPKIQRKRSTAKEKLKFLIAEIGSMDFLIYNNGCLSKHCNKCWEQIEKIAKRLQQVKCFPHKCDDGPVCEYEVDVTDD